MEKGITLDGVLRMLSGLSRSNRKWLADRLYESVREEEKTKEHDAECMMLYPTFKQVKALKEGKLETRNVEELLNEC